MQRFRNPTKQFIIIYRTNSSNSLKKHTGDSQNTSSKPLLLATLQNLELLLKMPGISNTDRLLDDLKTLNELGKEVPLCYYLDVAQILMHRNDLIRTELLIHICNENLSSKSLDNILYEKSNKSRPIIDPVNTLISYSISGLFRNGFTDEATKFWMRMTSLGYVTNRVDMEKMLDKIVGGSKSAPSIDFIDSIHKAMKAHLWHQHPTYYIRLLKVYRQHILNVCNSNKDLDYAIDKLQSLWKEIENSFCFSDIDNANNVPTELYALRLYCYSTAMFINRVKCLSDSKSCSYTDRALNALNSFLSVIVSQNYDDKLIEEQKSKTIVNHIKTEVNLVFENMISFGVDKSFSDTYKRNYDDNTIVRAGDNTKNIHFQMKSSIGSTRRAITGILLELAQQGQHIESLNILKKFIEINFFKDGNLSVATYVSTDLHDKTILNDKNYLSDYLNKAKQKVVSTQYSLDDDSFGNKLQIKSAKIQILTNPSYVRMIKCFAERRAASMYLTEEKKWQADLVCDILRCSNTIISLSKFENDLDISSKNEFDFRFLSSMTNLMEIFECFLKEYQLKPGSKFIASFVDAVCYNVKYLDSERSSSIIHKGYQLNWKSALSIAQLIIDKVEEKLGRNSEVYHSLIKLLCTSQKELDPNAVFQAISIVEQMKTERCEILSETLCVILDAATVCLDDADLYKVLNQLESIFQQMSSKLNLDEEHSLLKSRIFAHSRLREGFKALQLLRKLRSICGTADLRLYRWVINALHQSYPILEGEWMVAKDPNTTIDYILREMIRDGHKIDANIVSHLLRLYTKAIQISHSQGGFINVINEMESFILQCSSTAYMNSFTINVNEGILKEFIKAYCVVGMEEKALSVLRTAEEKYGVVVTAACYEPILFYYAGLKGLSNIAEDLLTEMINKQIPLSDAIVSTIVLTHVRDGDLSEALDCIQDLYNQHNVRPTINSWILLLDASLQLGDVPEAKRIVSLIKTLYTEQERDNLIGPAIPMRKLNNEKINKDDSSIDIEDLNKVEDLDKTKNEQRRSAAMNLYWNPPQEIESEDSSTMKFQPNIQLLPEHGYLIKLGTPLGKRQKGSLSNQALKERFKFYGYNF